jgi:hypothetical protein
MGRDGPFFKLARWPVGRETLNSPQLSTRLSTRRVPLLGLHTESGLHVPGSMGKSCQCKQKLTENNVTMKSLGVGTIRRLAAMHSALLSLRDTAHRSEPLYPVHGKLH